MITKEEADRRHSVERGWNQLKNGEAVTVEDDDGFFESLERGLERWREENRQSFESYNEMIEKRGLFSDDMGLL